MSEDLRKYPIVITEDQRLALMKAINHFQVSYSEYPDDELFGSLYWLYIELENLPSGKR